MNQAAVIEFPQAHPAPEFVQRIEQARKFNLQLAALRLLDRETYRGLRKYIRIPGNATERARVRRWRHLNSMLTRACVSRAEIAAYRSSKAIDPAVLYASRCLL